MIRRLLAFAKKSSGYFVSIGLTAVVGVVSVPAVISQAGAGVWAAMAVAQATGAIAGTFVAYGWPVVGPARIAAASAVARGALITTSVISRGILIVPALFVAIAATLLLNPGNSDTLVLIVAASSPVAGGLAAAWIFVGEARPRDLNLLEVAPRLGGTMVGVVVILATGDILLFVISQLLGTVVGLVLSYRALGRRYGLSYSSVTWASIGLAYRRGFPGLVTSAVTTTYQNLPLMIVAGLLPAQLPIFAMADRLYRIGQLALVPVTQVAQGYVPAAQSRFERRERILFATRGGVITGILVGGLFALFAPLGGQLLSAGAIAVPVAASLAFGAAIALTLMASIVGRACLVALGRDTSMAVASIVAAVVGVGAVVGGTVSLGLTGAATGVAVAEAAGLAVLVIALQRALSDGRSGPRTSEGAE